MKTITILAIILLLTGCAITRQNAESLVRTLDAAGCSVSRVVVTEHKQEVECR